MRYTQKTTTPPAAPRGGAGCGDRERSGNTADQSAFRFSFFEDTQTTRKTLSEHRSDAKAGACGNRSGERDGNRRTNNVRNGKRHKTREPSTCPMPKSFAGK